MRQIGQLYRQVGQHRTAHWRNLDAPATLRAAENYPTGFVDVDGPMVIDEIRLAPQLLLPIKVQVDADPRPGRYLLSGSARPLGLRSVPDTLPGRSRPSSCGRSPRARSTALRTVS